MNSNIIQLTDGSSKKDYELLLIFDKDGKEYAALEDINDEDSVLIMKLSKDGDEYIFETIEDESFAQELFVEFMAEWESLEDDE